jgi:hypothetical protein
MDPSRRIVTGRPTRELWDAHGNVSAQMLRTDLTEVEIKELLRIGPVQFVFAVRGEALKWVPMEERFDSGRRPCSRGSRSSRRMAASTATIFLPASSLPRFGRLTGRTCRSYSPSSTTRVALRRLGGILSVANATLPRSWLVERKHSGEASNGERAWLGRSSAGTARSV